MSCLAKNDLNAEPIFKYNKTPKIEDMFKINALPSYFQDFFVLKENLMSIYL